MSVTLYGSKSTASLVVHWLLIELEIPHELIMLDFDKNEQKSPEYLQLNPQGRVPTLVIDGQVLTESIAIVMHLADAYPQARLAPPVATPQRAAYYRWMLFCAYTLMPAFRGWFYADEPAGAENAEKVQASSRTIIEQAWQQLDEHLAAQNQGSPGPFILGGNSPSAVDFVLTMLMRWSRGMPKPSDAWPRLKQLADAMKSRPAFKETYRREGIEDWKWKDV